MRRPEEPRLCSTALPLSILPTTSFFDQPERLYRENLIRFAPQIRNRSPRDSLETKRNEIFAHLPSLPSISNFFRKEFRKIARGARHFQRNVQRLMWSNDESVNYPYMATVETVVEDKTWLYIVPSREHPPFSSCVWGKDRTGRRGDAEEQRSFENFDVRHSSAAAWQLQFR